MGHSEFSWQSKTGIKIYAQEWKPAEARAVVALVHGLGEHSGRFAHVADFLNQAGYAVITFDLPGHGKTEGQRGHSSFMHIVDEIHHLLAETTSRYPQKPCFLYGHSLGGGLVLHYTLQRQPKLQGVVATSPPIAPGSPIPGLKVMVGKVMARVYPSFPMTSGLDVNNLSHDPAVVRAYQDDPLVHDHVSAMLGLDLITCGEWLLANAANFPLPLLLVQGTGDHVVSPAAVKQFAQAVPKDRVVLKEFEGLYHETHNEPEKYIVLRCIVDWLNLHL